MPLSEEQKAELRAQAEAAGIDPARAIAAAESIAEAESARDAPDDEKPKSAKAGAAPPAEELPKLFMYHLPFVRVREVRQRWLGLTEAFPGDDEVAAQWAAKMQPTSGTPAATDTPEE